MQKTVQPLTQNDASCADASRRAAAPRTEWAPIFPPRDADAETRRRWLASSPWPEVVFASAGGW